MRVDTLHLVDIVLAEALHHRDALALLDSLNRCSSVAGPFDIGTLGGQC
jgi:hypothetical protein